jgi:hypothetical protein
MGLDWNPLGKPRPGAEDVYYRYIAQNSDPGSWVRPTALKFGKRLFERAVSADAFHDSQISPYETLNAPQVGSHHEADRWAAERYAEAEQRPPTLEEWIEGLRGYQVLALLPEDDGFPLYTNWPVNPIWERWTFRAEFLKDCEAVIGPDLLDRAWLNHLPAQLEDYGSRLWDCASRYAEEHGVGHVLNMRSVDDDEAGIADSPALTAHLIASAARWARIWSGRGHGVAADY